MINFEIRKNEQFNSNEIYFDSKPGEDVREALKALHFRWNGKKSCWYGFAEEEIIRAAISSENVLSIPDSVVVEAGSLYEGWRGGNNSKWCGYDELKSLLLEDFKRAGIKASIRRERAGYLLSINVTLKLSAGDILPFESWKPENYYISPSQWHYYTDEEGKVVDIWGERYYDLEAEEQKAMYENIIFTDYQLRRRHIESGYTLNNYDVDILAPAALQKFFLLKTIVASYNHDQTNTMVDYFDRDIYDDYSIKIA